MKQTFDHSEYKHKSWYEDLIDVFEEIAFDDDVPANDKSDVVKHAMQSFFYGDTTCDCGGPKTNYPFKIEATDDDSLTATYQCRNCGTLYKGSFTKDWRLLSFG